MLHACGLTEAGFPLHGVVTRAQLLRMLRARIGLCVHNPQARPPPSRSRMPASQVRAYTGNPSAPS